VIDLFWVQFFHFFVFYLRVCGGHEVLLCAVAGILEKKVGKLNFEKGV
jgi:hypothetical protein